jgi:hypothetical protein
MAFSFPIVKSNNNICGSCVYYKRIGQRHYFLTTLHQIGIDKADFGIVFPPAAGNINAWQPYPINNIPFVRAEIVRCDPFLDLAIVSCDLDNSWLPESIGLEDSASNY